MGNKIEILLTGGTGFLGTAFLKYLQEQHFSCRVHVISSGRTKFEVSKNTDISYIYHDLTQPAVCELFQDISFDVLIHLATSSTLGSNSSEFVKFDDIQKIDRAVLDIALKVQCPNVIWASSGAVYGPSETKKPFKEKDRLVLQNLAHENAYRIGKIQSEYRAQKFCEEHGINLCIMRLFAFSGEDLPLNVHFALGNFIQDAILNKQINITGTGMAVRSYMDQSDFARILTQIVLAGSEAPHVLNVGAAQAYTLKEVAHKVAMNFYQNFGHKLEVLIHNKAEDADSFYVPDTSRLIAFLKNERFIDLDTSIKKMLEFAKTKLNNE
jgi:nucleoside-diphosphate-sugar epimerase